jgi:hypothetical protein
MTTRQRLCMYLACFVAILMGIGMGYIARKDTADRYHGNKACPISSGMTGSGNDHLWDKTGGHPCIIVIPQGRKDIFYGVVTISPVDGVGAANFDRPASEYDPPPSMYNCNLESNQ